MKIPFEWESLGLVESHASFHGNARAKVYGGWIFKNIAGSVNTTLATSMVFVPDPNHEWEV